MVPLLALAVAGCGPETAGVDPKTWHDKWCQVSIGMTPQQVTDIMGKPTEEYMGDGVQEGFDSQLIYDAGEWHFTAFFNLDGRVRQLDINTIDLAAEQVAALKCPETRREVRAIAR